jgi:hypothetical protein
MPTWGWALAVAAALLLGAALGFGFAAWLIGKNAQDAQAAAAAHADRQRRAAAN